MNSFSCYLVGFRQKTWSGTKSVNLYKELLLKLAVSLIKPITVTQDHFSRKDVLETDTDKVGIE